MEEITTVPAFVSAEQLAQLQTSTPQSFDSIPPVLHLHLAESTVYVSPSPSARPSCFEQINEAKRIHDGTANDEDDQDETDTFRASGQLWLTEREISFLSPTTGSGFRLGYANVALHAVTRSPPTFLSTSSFGLNGASSTASLSDFPGCLYCQLDLSPNAGTAEMGVEDDEEGEFVEMYICTPDSASLDRLFEALSHCASLHPSGTVEDDGGHPFAGFAPFGTSASGVQLGDDDDEEDGAYDDADADDQELSETGRVRADFQTPDSRFRPY